MKWKNKCKKLFVQNKTCFDYETFDEWLSTEDFFECLWYYLNAEVKGRAEIEDKKRAMEEEMKQKYRKGMLSPIDVMVGQACGILNEGNEDE